MAAEAEAGITLIVLPCWMPATAAATAAGLEWVHLWNEMVQMRNDAADDDPQTADTVATHLSGVCLGRCPR